MFCKLQEQLIISLKAGALPAFLLVLLEISSSICLCKDFTVPVSFKQIGPRCKLFYIAKSALLGGSLRSTSDNNLLFFFGDLISYPDREISIC
jgi:hypothetical protein